MHGKGDVLQLGASVGGCRRDDDQRYCRGSRCTLLPRDDDPTHPPKVRVANGKVHMTISPENQRLCSPEVVGFLLLNLYLSASDY